MPSYSTIVSSAEREDSSRVLHVALGCALLGLVAGVIASTSNTALYSPVATQSAVQALAPVTSLRQPVTPYSRGVSAVAANNEDADASSSPSVSPVSVFGGLAVAAGAALGAMAAKLFQASKAGAETDPLSLVAKYQEAEARWSMMAATAFVGTKAPDFTATAVFDQEFVDLQLSQYRGKKYVVLFFYPLDFTFVCPTEITAFSDRAAEFEALNTQILGVSVDSQFSHLAWVQTPRNQGGLGDINYPLVADLKKEIAEAYGVLTEEGIALRGLFIIDKEGVIQHATINNLAFGRNVDETVRVLEALQYVQANPDEVCPAGWKKGDKTMKPDPQGSKEYFQAL